MVKDIEKRGWNFTRRADSVVKVKFASELASWLPSQSALLERYQVTNKQRLVDRIESFKSIDDEIELHRKLTRAVQQFVTRDQWAEIRAHFYRFKRQNRDGIKVVAVSEAVWSDLIRIKDSNGFSSLNEVVDDLLSHHEVAMESKD